MLEKKYLKARKSDNVIEQIKPYIIFLRIKSIPSTFFLTFTGYAISNNRPTNFTQILTDCFFILVTVSFFIWGGTNAFNSSQDRDTGPVNFIENPPPVPKYLTQYSLIMMLTGVALSAIYGITTFILACISFLLSIYYSWENNIFKRGKDIVGMDMLINITGCGFISILYGYSITGIQLNYQVLIASIGFSIALLGGIPTSQIFQLNTDIKKNYTSVLTPAKTLKLGSLLFLTHIIVLISLVNDWNKLLSNKIQLLFFIGWFGLVSISAIHSYIWSKNPLKNSYNKMIRQLTTMMLSQVCWIIYIWIETR